MKQRIKTVIFAFAAIMMICLVSNSASAQSNGLMKALNVNGQAKTISYNNPELNDDYFEFSFNKNGGSQNASNSSYTNTKLSEYWTRSGCELGIKNSKWNYIYFEGQDAACYVVFTAYDASGRPIKADLYYSMIDSSELAKRGAKVTCSGNDAKGNWTKMTIDRSSLIDRGCADIIPRVINRKIRYW